MHLSDFIIGKNIADCRKQKKLTQKELALKCGFATGTIQQYELGKRKVSIEKLRIIANALEIDIQTLVQNVTTSAIKKPIFGEINTYYELSETDNKQLKKGQTNLITLEQHEAMTDNVRYEVFEGIPCAMASPSELHQTILLELSFTLREYIRSNKGNCKVVVSPFDVVLNDKPLTLVQPDIIIVCNRDKLDGKRCVGAPDFVVEIVSPNSQSEDYIRKLYYYKNYGIREYWIVDPRKKTVTVNYFEGDIINEHYTFNSNVKVNIYNDLYVDFAELSGRFNG